MTITARRLFAFGILAVLAVVGAVLLASQRATPSRSQSDLLYPALKTEADSVATIRIFRAGDQRALEIVRDGERWSLTERDGYPVAAAKVRNLVRALANAKVLEEKTSDPEKYAALSVEDVSNQDAQGVRIEIAGPKTPIDLIVGKAGPGGKSSYVRRIGERQSWLVGEQLSASPETRDWLDQDLINVSADRIQAANITTAGQKPYSASKTSRADAKFKITPLPKGKELNGPSAANAVATALSHLTLDDVRSKPTIATGKPTDRATYKTFDGLVVQIDGYAQDEQRYVVLTTAFDPALAEQFRVATATDEKTVAAPQRQSTVESEARDTAAKLAPWAYEIPRYKYDAIFQPLAGMLKN